MRIFRIFYDESHAHEAEGQVYSETGFELWTPDVGYVQSARRVGLSPYV